MKTVSEKIYQDLAALAVRPESEINLSDIPETTAADWEGARRGQFYRPIKQQLTVRIDADVLAWLKENGKGYQSRMNDILRAEMLKSLRHDT